VGVEEICIAKRIISCYTFQGRGIGWEEFCIAKRIVSSIEFREVSVAGKKLVI
jgi:hypothetical protein